MAEEWAKWMVEKMVNYSAVEKDFLMVLN